LRRALQSIARSAVRPAAVVVADDSTNDSTRTLVAERFPEAIYVSGARRGLGANRNTALRHARGTHVLFIDDDVELNETFLGDAASVLAANAPRTILTGVERQNGRAVPPSKVSFLGYQSKAYMPQENYETIVINATVFPRRLFYEAKFDENLIYGCEEMDIASRATRLHGYKILFRPDIDNAHYPAAGNRAYYAPTSEASRIYVMFKRYAWVERKPMKALLFLAIAYAHMLAHGVKQQGLSGLRSFWITLSYSAAYIARCWLAPERYL